MSHPVIQVETLGKKYRIGAARRTHGRFSELLADSGRRGARRLARAAAWLAGRRQGAGGNEASAHDFWALREISFAVERGEVLGLIGRNGAGKSTLLKLLARITRPTEGAIRLRGRVGSLLEIGAGFHPELTGRENIALNGAILGMTRAEIRRKFDEIVAFAEIGPFLDTPVKHYSSGMYMRLAFAVAAHLEPEILLVDEVLAVGDAEFQRKCLGKMGEAAGHGRTVLFVSHNLAAVQQLCHRTVLLRGGRVEMIGDSEQVIATYLEQASATQIEWRREEPWPEGPHFREARLVDATGQPCRVPTTAGELGVELVIGLPVCPPRALLAVLVDDSLGNAIFSTSPIDRGLTLPTSPGVYRVMVWFPQGIFMAKEYRIRLSLYDDLGWHDLQSPALTFHVAEVATWASALPRGRLGSLQLLCRWSTFTPQ